MGSVKILLILFITLSACKKLKPAGFWEGYEKQFLKEKVSDFGPQGGLLAMHWRESSNGAFSKYDILTFAESNGWKCVDTVSISSGALAKWLVTGKAHFPFSYTDFSDLDNLELKFPRWIDSDVTVYRHTTGWLAVQPGNAVQTEINGYIVVSSDSSQFSVYHLWGE